MMLERYRPYHCLYFLRNVAYFCCLSFKMNNQHLTRRSLKSSCFWRCTYRNFLQQASVSSVYSLSLFDSAITAGLESASFENGTEVPSPSSEGRKCLVWFFLTSLLRAAAWRAKFETNRLKKLLSSKKKRCSVCVVKFSSFLTAFVVCSASFRRLGKIRWPK